MFLACALAAGSGTASQADSWAAMRIWYERPAQEWVEALPVGNGSLGAMVFGGVSEERLQFNEDTLWTGKPRDYSHVGASRHLATVRQLLFEGKQSEADALAEREMMSIPLGQEFYQPFGDLRLTFPGHDGATDYKRELDIDSAVATVNYKVGDVAYQREAFASAPGRAIVMRLTASKPGALDFSIRLDSPQPAVEFLAIGENQIAMRGQLPAQGHPSGQPDNCLRYEARLRIQTDGGTLKVAPENAEVAGADSATLVLVAATSYLNYSDVSANPAERCREALAATEGKTYAAMREAHVADHRALFRRVQLDLGTTDAARAPSDARIKTFAEGNDPQMAALYFQYGRYLLIASSRPGSQPANLQGLWNEHLQPPWGSKYTVNINTEMNYWPSEPCNLSECTDPLFALLEDVAVTGARVAKEHYDCRGWVLHHNTDLWRGAAPINAANHGIWVTGGAWLTQHLWYHYEFTGDKEFLAQRAYPIMRGAAQFFVDFLIEDPRTGYLISSPSNSPEQGGLVAGPTMDHQIIRDLFNNVIAASEILDVDADFRKIVKEKRDRLAPMQIGRLGQLQEWLEDVDDPKNEHRHVSHLYGLFPSSQIARRTTPDLYAAARQSLIFRGDGGTGWSMGWKINLWARLEDGDHAYKMLSRQISPERTYPNLFDAHPPFQIDGNFGATSGIAQMLLQSHSGEVHLLPALPSAWASGRVDGLCARGGWEVAIEWAEGRVQGASLRAKLGGPCRVRSALPLRVATAHNQEPMAGRLNRDADGTYILEFQSEKGGVYALEPAQ